VTRDDMLGALNEVANKAKAAKDPLVVYYFIGHGQRLRGGHVSLLGGYKRSDPADVARSRTIIETEEVEELLERQLLPYILILDNCYYRAPETEVGTIISSVYREVEEIAPRVVGRLFRRTPTDFPPWKPALWIVLYSPKESGNVRPARFGRSATMGKG